MHSLTSVRVRTSTSEGGRLDDASTSTRGWVLRTVNGNPQKRKSIGRASQPVAASSVCVPGIGGPEYLGPDSVVDTQKRGKAPAIQRNCEQRLATRAGIGPLSLGTGAATRKDSGSEVRARRTKPFSGALVGMPEPCTAGLAAGVATVGWR